LSPGRAAALVDETRADGQERASATHGNCIHISAHMMELLLELFTADQLQHLATIKRQRAPYLVARRRLNGASAEELVEMIVAGKRPTVGWWSRQMARAS
jgi:hypothetical protein